MGGGGGYLKSQTSIISTYSYRDNTRKLMDKRDKFSWNFLVTFTTIKYKVEDNYIVNTKFRVG